MKEEPDNRIWKSYVWHKEKCFFVSTIDRSYETYEGSIRGIETLVWEFDWQTAERGALIYQSSGVSGHQTICRCVIAEGEMPDENNPNHERFFA